MRDIDQSKRIEKCLQKHSDWISVWQDCVCQGQRKGVVVETQDAENLDNNFMQMDTKGHILDMLHGKSLQESFVGVRT